MGGRESAAEEVARVCELASQLQILLLHNSPRGARELSQELLQSLTAALSVLDPGKDKLVSFERPAATMLNSKDKLFSFQRPAATMLNSSSSYIMKRGDKEPICMGSQLQSSRNPVSRGTSCSRRIELTSSPYYDGQEWRKYGQKDISGTNFPRCYYKCTYEDKQGCPATKKVQQKNWNDPPMFEVWYDMQHNCKSKFIHPQLPMDESILNITPNQISFSSSSIPTTNYESTSNELGHTGHTGYPSSIPTTNYESTSNELGHTGYPSSIPTTNYESTSNELGHTGYPDFGCAVSPDPTWQGVLDGDMEILRALLEPNTDFSSAGL